MFESGDPWGPAGAGPWPERAGGSPFDPWGADDEPTACDQPAEFWADHPDRWVLEAPVDLPVAWGAVVGRAWVASAAGELRVDPGVDLVAAVVDLLPEGRVGVLSDDELVRLVTATHRLVGWLTTVRADATRVVGVCDVAAGGAGLVVGRGSAR